jgi:hypothetical protein
MLRVHAIENAATLIAFLSNVLITFPLLLGHRLN